MSIAATLAANVLEGLEHGPLAATIATWPAVALVISYELTTWVIRSGRQIADHRTSGVVPEVPEENQTGPAPSRRLVSGRKPRGC